MMMGLRIGELTAQGLVVEFVKFGAKEGDLEDNRGFTTSIG